MRVSYPTNRWDWHETAIVASKITSDCWCYPKLSALLGNHLAHQTQQVWSSQNALATSITTNGYHRTTGSASRLASSYQVRPKSFGTIGN